MLSIYLDIVIHLLFLKLNMLSFLQIKLGYLNFKNYCYCCC